MHVKISRILRFALILASLSLSIGLLRSLIGVLLRSDVVGERRMILEQEKARNTALQDQLKEATSASFVEKLARDKLGLVRSGDTVVLLGTPSAGVNFPGQTGGQGEPMGWKKWWSLFF